MKKLFALLLAALMLFAVIGCGLKVKKDALSDQRGDWRVKMATCYNADGSVSYCVEVTCDKDGNIVKETWLDPDGSVDDRYEYEYDANGNMIRIVKHDPDGTYYTYCENEWTYFKNAPKNGKKTVY